jgi:hypothetical protein
MKRFVKALAACALILLIGISPLDGRDRPHYTFILPDGYVGWVQVVFNDPRNFPLPIQKNGGRVIEVPESGIPRTSDLRVHDFKKP